MTYLHVFSPGFFAVRSDYESFGEYHAALSKAIYEKVKQLAFEHYGAERLKIEKTPRGKPYFENSDIFFSISHCEKSVAVSFSNSRTGVDAECLREFKPYALTRLFSENELAYISADTTRRAIELWTLREAISKAHGDGFTDWFYHAGLADENGKLLSKYRYRETEYHLHTFDYNDFIVSVACEANEEIKIEEGR